MLYKTVGKPEYNFPESIKVYTEFGTDRYAIVSANRFKDHQTHIEKFRFSVWVKLFEICFKIYTVHGKRYKALYMPLMQSWLFMKEIENDC